MNYSDVQLNEDYHNLEFRRDLRAEPKKTLKEYEYPIEDDLEIQVVTNTKEVFYVAMIDHSNLNENYLQQLYGGEVNVIGNKFSSAGTASSVGTLGTASTLTGTAATFGTVACALTASSAACTD